MLLTSRSCLLRPLSIETLLTKVTMAEETAPVQPQTVPVVAPELVPQVVSGPAPLGQLASATPAPSPLPPMTLPLAVPPPPPPPVPLAASMVPPVASPPPVPGLSAAKTLATGSSCAGSVHPTCFPPLEEFAEDIELKLGRANGNIYHRREGIESVHDGQIMVRLKKKRFIVIDYGIIPTAMDIAAASVYPQVSCPAGAGKQKCVTAECPKRGVPVLLYDSDPSEPASLYLRSGLCFTCQRILNEKRRTQRKRKSDSVAPTSGAEDHHHHMNHGAQGMHLHPHTLPHGGGHGLTPLPAAGNDQSRFHHMDPATAAAAKRFRLNGDIVDLSPDAIIINGPLDGTKQHGPGYGFSEIGADLMFIVAEASRVTERLVGSTVLSQDNGSVDNETLQQTHSGQAPLQHTPEVPVQPGGESAVDSQSDVVAVAAAAAAAAAVGVGDSGVVESAVTAAALAARSSPSQPQTLPPSKEEIPALYEKAFLSLSRAIYLLSQWKASRDAHDAEESARKAALDVPHIPLSSVSDHGGLIVNADAVVAAAAAAVASASAAASAAAPPPPLQPTVPLAAETAVGVATPIPSQIALASAIVPAAPTPVVAMPKHGMASTVATPGVAMDIPAAADAVKSEVPSRTGQDVAAVAAAVSSMNGTSMIPLLLAAEGREEGSMPKVEDGRVNGATTAVHRSYPHDKSQVLAATFSAEATPGTEPV
uniref:Uncharacterized protein n=1 Tax=Odontella aurita TaxID=265563 RepID=A0A7S4IU86_9STRA|mmetsp:Transcript_30423/g.90806  ORF Transcript_30423/g.90806 Transcript_30423/m.90806 type:complete len:706 (+) Transcript_30423:454-2571(+)